MKDDYKSLLSANLLGLLEEYVPDFFYIVDYQAGKYLYVSESITDCLGHSPKRFYLDDGVAFILSIIHPDDLQPTLNAYTRFEQSEFVGKVPAATIEYRVKHSQGHFVWIRSRDHVVEFTEEGKVKISLGMVAQLDKTRQKEVSMFASSDIAEVIRETYSRYEARKKDLEKLSYRELEVIDLLAQGLTSRQIASELEIREHTVETHRRNILEKLGLSNTVQTVNLVCKYKRLR